ncbi:MAG TPA: recombinase family protein [Anaerolineae bacterium]|nr:recombinase family protein [Anaerolineae bacterium]
MNKPDSYPHASKCPSDDEVRQRVLQLLADNQEAHAPESESRLCAAGYTRVSSVMQLDGTSLEDQEQRITAYIAEQGWQLQALITDPAESGRNSKRAGFLRLQRLVREGRVQVVVVDRIDRIARDLGVFLAFLALLRRTDVQLVSLREGIDYRRAWGKLMLYILGGLAEFYSDNLAQEIRNKRLMDAVHGKLAPTYRFGYCMGTCSACKDPNGAGYCPEYGKADRRGAAFRIPHPVESVAVQLMFEWYAGGSMSFADIAQRLNEEVYALPEGTEVRFRTKGRPGYSLPGRFDADAVREILSNVIYTGRVTYAGSTQTGKKLRQVRDIFPGHHQPLVDDLTFARVQQIRKQRYARPATLQRRIQPFVLARLLFCAHRHSPIRSQSAGGHRYYMDQICRLKHREFHQPHVRAAILEEQVRTVVGQLVLPERWIERILAYLFYDEGEAALLQDRLDLHYRLETEQYLLRDGVISRSEFERRRSRILSALQSLDLDATPVSHEAREILSDLPALLAALEPQEENSLYQAIFFQLLVDQDQIVAYEVYAPFLPLHPQFTLPDTHESYLGPYPVP